MRFIVLFEDAPGADPGIRKAHMRAHLDFLERNAVEAAGPLADSEGKGRDGLWLVEAPDRAAVERIVRADPFWPTGLRKSVAILEWRQVLAGGRRLIDPD